MTNGVYSVNGFKTRISTPNIIMIKKMRCAELVELGGGEDEKMHTNFQSEYLKEKYY